MVSESVVDANMAIEEEYSKQKSDSPALTEATSYTSSPDASPLDESKNGLSSSIRRKLFSNEDSPKDTIDSPTCTSLVVREAVLTPRGSENGTADATSTTSSETTAIPSWNLSNASEKNVEVPLENFVLSQSIPLMTPPPHFPSDKTRPILSSASSGASDETNLSGVSSPQLLEIEPLLKASIKSDIKAKVAVEKEGNKPSLVVEDPPEEPSSSSCNAAMNIAEIVMAFGQSARQRYQGTSEQTESTEPKPVTNTDEPTKRIPFGSPPPMMTSRRVSEGSTQSEKSQNGTLRSIEQERDSLKTNAKRDAYTILKLQQAVDAQKQLNSLKEVEIVDKQAEIQVLTKRIRTLQKEQEDNLERETELRETIKILKTELDKMTMLKSVPSDELEHLKLESETSNNQVETFIKEAELAKSHAKEQDARIEELEKALKQKEEENFGLQTKIDWLNDQNKDEKMDDPHEITIGDTKPLQLEVRDLSVNDEIENRLKEIMKRLEAVEIEKQEIESDLEKKSEGNSGERNSVMKQNESEHNGVKINVSEDPDQIEAMRMKGETDKIADSVNLVNQSTWCCEWGLISEE